ncbi:glycoside hydrolase family 13 protein [Nocardioides terrisoli]|uniref:glycoside hydrolase family 13 protein n=1 Tax=Nocardioides terrisoli TaxID=3388267 RepID=UPI00287B7DA2|nr:glycoside hydrolase family 13 protein [Nocardioides marmorisolisilvae]
MTSHLLDEPHHDGSPLYLDDETPALGSEVGVRVRTSAQRTVDAVWVRTVEDAEPFYAAMEVESRDDATVWWRGRVHVRNPVQHYRFMVVGGDGYTWLNQSGVHDHDVPDAEDFVISTYDAAPDWARDAVVYQIFPDRFARSSAADDRPTPAWAKPADWADPPIHEGPDTPLQLYGGDLDGIVEHLDHVQSLGADTVYLTPVFPAESNHRYNASTFDSVDPLLGGDEAYRRLVDACHARGLRVMGDLTSNHTGDTHEWFVRASTDVASTERAFYYFGPDGSHEGWKGVETLPKLDHLDAELGRRLRSVVQHWLRFGLDGWRIDVANMTGRHVAVDVAHDVAREIRRAGTEVHADVSIVGEHGHDASGDLDGDGWHGTMNYYGFSFPVWEFVRRPDGNVPSFGLPVGVPRRSGERAMTSLRSFLARFGWRAVQQSWNILGSHDTARIRTITGGPALHHVAIALQFTLPGVPMVFAGDELGLEGVDGEDSRRTIDWSRPLPEETQAVYRRYAELRRTHPALRRGSLRWVHLAADLVVFLREHPDGDVLVAVSRGGSPAVALPDPLPDIPAYDEPAAHLWPL